MLFGMRHLEHKLLTFQPGINQIDMRVALDLPRTAFEHEKVKDDIPAQFAAVVVDGQLDAGLVVQLGCPRPGDRGVRSSGRRSHQCGCQQKSSNYFHNASFVSCYCPLPRAATPSVPPSPMVSTTEEGTITIEPLSLIASYNMFMARRCRATGLST